ncbi:MAG TPA: nucleotidyltransferase domain-containing protein [Isosphaeraceae bacterium]|nr:nucleotidyltransferase domain-containing protein [Isosphaeraceae bacterium]
MSIRTLAIRSHITLPMEAIAALCERYHVEELSVFGSVLRDDFGPESDVDFLVVFKDDDHGPWMGKLTGPETELSDLLGRRIDLVPKPLLKWVIRDRVLAEAEPIYVATSR